LKLKTLTNRLAFAFSMLLAAAVIALAQPATAGTSCSTRKSGSVRLSERHGVVAAFAKKSLAEEWAQMRSFNDESRFTVHTAAEVLFVFQDGEEVR